MQASLSILRKNLAQPFSLTLLNIGATSFLASAPAQRVVPKALRSFLRAGQGSSRHKSTSSQQVAGHAGALHSIVKLMYACECKEAHRGECHLETLTSARL